MKKKEWIEQKEREDYYYDKPIGYNSDNHKDPMKEYEMNILHHDDEYDYINYNSDDDYDKHIGGFSDY